MNKETQEVIGMLQTLIMMLELNVAEVIEVSHDIIYEKVTNDGFIVDYSDTGRRKETILWRLKI